MVQSPVIGAALVLMLSGSVFALKHPAAPAPAPVADAALLPGPFDAQNLSDLHTEDLWGIIQDFGGALADAWNCIKNLDWNVSEESVGLQTARVVVFCLVMLFCRTHTISDSLCAGRICTRIT